MIPSALLAGLALACGASTVGEVAPDFVLTDVNAASASYLADVSPREKLDKVSAWYFGHST